MVSNLTETVSKDVRKRAMCRRCGRDVGVAREVCAEGREDARSLEEIFWRGRKCSQIEPVQSCEKIPRYGRTINRTIREGRGNPQLAAFTTTNKGGVGRIPRENSNNLKAMLM